MACQASKSAGLNQLHAVAGEGARGDQQFRDASDRLARVSTDSAQLQDFEDAEGPSELSQVTLRAGDSPHLLETSDVQSQLRSSLSMVFH